MRRRLRKADHVICIDLVKGNIDEMTNRTMHYDLLGPMGKHASVMNKGRRQGVMGRLTTLPLARQLFLL